MMRLTRAIEQAGYRVPAMLQSKAYIMSSEPSDDRVVIIPMIELWNKTPDECKAIIENAMSKQDESSDH